MVASFAVIHSVSYYTRQSPAVSYYADGETAGIWLRGHLQLGATAGKAVRHEDFDRICAGLDISGHLLVKSTSVGPRMFGVDITCSSPKAVSVFWALADDPTRQAIEDAEGQALESTIGFVEREIPLARRGHGGASREKAQFTAAVFTHSESRPEEHADGTIMPDPQRHHHICIANIAQREDGSWGAIDSVALRAAKKAIGAVYRLELASALQERGLTIERDDDDWKWSISGVPQALCEYFSARRASLEEELAEAGVTPATAPALAAATNATGRRAKLDLSIVQLSERWRDAALRLGYQPEQIIANVVDSANHTELPPADIAGLRARRLSQIPKTLTAHAATFSRRELIECIANALVGTRASLDDCLEATDALLASGQVIELAQTRDGPAYSTPQMLAAERTLVELVLRNANSRVTGPKTRTLKSLLANTMLNGEQQQAISAATSGKRLTLVQGGAGTGKSTTLKTISAAWQSAGYTVLGAAVAWRAADDLGDDLGIEARAIDSWLKAIDLDKSPFADRTCLIVEEGGLQATPQALRLLQAVDRAGGVAVIVGDEDQLRPVGPGHAMRLIRETIGATRIDTVVRQREEWARQAPGAFARGEAHQALAAFDERGLMRSCATARATVHAIADRWQHLIEAAPHQSVLVTAKTNAEVRALAAAIRMRLRVQGEITGPDIALEAADASGNRHTLRLAVGDRVRFLQRNDALGVVNGTQARIVAIKTERDGDTKITAEKDGQPFTFTPADVADPKGRARLSHSYAATLFQAQGLTVDHALVLLSTHFDRHDAYVASSRARDITEFFYDIKAVDKQRHQSQQTATDADSAEARLAYLATQLAPRSLKTNALDIIAEHERTAPYRNRRCEHQFSGGLEAGHGL